MSDGEVIAILGGGSGLGLGVAEYLIDIGKTIAILDFDAEKIDLATQRFGSRILAFQGDVRRSASLAAFHDAMLERFGVIDALIGVQGIFDGNRPLREISLDQLDATFDELMHVNVRGYIAAAKIFHESLAKRRGAIVLTGSVAASYAADGGGIFYTASKHAVLGVVRQLAFEFAPDVRVNGVAPCAIANSDLRGPEAMGLRTESQADVPRDVLAKSFGNASLLQGMPSGRDYGPIYALLATSASATMTGEIIKADQGCLNRPIISASRRTTEGTRA